MDFRIANGYYMEKMEVLDAIRSCRKQFLKKFGYVPRDVIIHENECNPVIISKLEKLNIKVRLSVKIQTRHVFFPIVKRKPKRFYSERIAYGQ